jgi:hypothetical protein
MAIRRRKIEHLIEELLTSHRIAGAPVPVERIAKAKGARIFLWLAEISSAESCIDSFLAQAGTLSL